MTRFRLILIAALLSCGGKAKGPDEPLARADELKKDKVVEPDASAGAAPIAEPPPSEVKPTPPPPEAAVTFELRNDGATDLVFTTTKGWQPVLFAYTGAPPKAKTVYLFEASCTAACDAQTVCPVCNAPATKKEELAMAKKETAQPGSSVKVPWEGKVVVYQKAAGKKCKCFTKADPAPDSYTIKACGLRQAKDKGKPSKAVCAETTVALPTGPGQTVTLSFK